jgi:hypothetical protein
LRVVLPVPAIRQFSVDEVETASYLNSLSAALSFLTNPPLATVYQTAAQAMSSGSPMPITYDSTIVDTYGGHSNTVSPARYTAVVPGYYIIGGGAPMSGSTGGTYRKLQMYYNGTAVGYATSAVPPTSSTANAVTPALSPTLTYLNAGDFVGLYGAVDATGVVTTASALNEAYMTVVWAHA